jgi:sorting nexin-8
VSNKPRVSQLEFFVALALVALAQTGKGAHSQTTLETYSQRDPLDVSIEQVAALASQNTLPEPSLHLDSLPSSTANAAALQFARQNPTRDVTNRAPSYNSEDPWNTARAVPGPAGPSDTPPSGGPSVVAGSGLPDGWWKNQSKVQVNLLGLQGFILNRYTVYEVVSDVSPIVKQPAGCSAS